MKNIEKIRKSSILVMFVVSIILILYWIIFKNFFLIIYSVVSLLIVNVLIAFNNLRNRIFFLFFNLTISLFLVSRPLIDFIYMNEFSNYDKVSGGFTLFIIFISLISLLIGLLIIEKKEKKRIKVIELITQDNFKKNICKVSKYLFYFCFIFNMIMGIEKIIFSNGNTYLDYYTTFQTKLPNSIKGISTMMQGSLAIYLASMPKKKECFRVLIAYFFSGVPNLIIGSRGAISENLIFIFLYFFIRNNLNEDGKERNFKWITSRMKKMIIIIVPIIIIFFSFYSYIRFDDKKDNKMNPIIDFAYSQGVTFTVLARGFEKLPDLPDVENKNYTFGPFIDYIKTGTPAQILFGAKSLGSANSIERATLGNSLSAALSYTLYGNMYLRGYGTGSSYILEVFCDYGIIGVIIFNVILGMLLGKIGTSIKNNLFVNIFLIRILMDIFIIPRGSALSWLTFLIAPQFWLPIILCFLISKIIRKNIIGGSNEKKTIRY